MSKPEIHTFGIAKYVYASAYDQLEAERDALRVTMGLYAKEISTAIYQVSQPDMSGGNKHKAKDSLTRISRNMAREAREGEGG